EIAPAGKVWRIDHNTGCRIQGPGRADSNPMDQAVNSVIGKSDGKRIYRRNYSGKTGGSVAVRNHGGTRLILDLSVAVYEPRGYFGASDINPNDQAVLHCDLHHYPIPPKLITNRPNICLKEDAKVAGRREYPCFPA